GMASNFVAVLIAHDPLVGCSIQLDFNVLAGVLPSCTVVVGKQGNLTIALDLTLKVEARQIVPYPVERPLLRLLVRAVGALIGRQARIGLTPGLPVGQTIALALGVHCPS